MSDVIIRVSRDFARRIRLKRTPMEREVLKIIEEFGLLLEPLHPGTDDAELMRYYFFQANPEKVDINALVNRLRNANGIDSAYMKPREAPP